MKKFRHDINGLRAIAVIAVVLFHFNPNWLSGGFAGVDVFFVISGFLMTGIIFRGLENKNFSILSFYVSRANRIIPALATLCLVLLAFGWFFLPPFDYKALANHASSSVAFFSNIIYWREAGYFDAASHEKWLLHTWSLSVEWQFYIIYPLVLTLFSKFISLNKMKLLLVAGCVLGFLFSVFATIKWPEAAYYLLPTRTWEMMLGGVAYLYPIKVKRKGALEWAGLSLIVASYILFSQETLWPGYLSILPVMGTFLVIQAHNNNSVISNNIVFQKIGSWSYSIYLWHWPFVVLIYYFTLSEAFIYLGLIMSVLFGFISFTYIERIQFKNRLTSLLDYLTFKPFYIALFVTIISYQVYSSNGALSRFSEIPNLVELESNRSVAEGYYRENLLAAFSNQGEAIEDSYVCTLDEGKQTYLSVTNCLSSHLNGGGYLVIGDSHGRDFLHSLTRAFPDENFSMLHQSGCVPTQYEKCFLLLEQLKEGFIKGNKSIKGIIYSSLYENENAVNKLVSELNMYNGKSVLLVGASLRLEKTVVEESIKNKSVTEIYDLKGSINDAVAPINKKLLSVKTVHFFDRYATFCSGSYCQINDGLNPYVWDSDHLTLLGINRLANELTDIVFFNQN